MQNSTSSYSEILCKIISEILKMFRSTAPPPIPLIMVSVSMVLVAHSLYERDAEKGLT